MSFINILKQIGGIVIGAEHILAPVAECVLPSLPGPIAALDNVFQRLQASIATAEANNPATGQGAVKAPDVVADFESGLELTQQILSLEKKKLVYDPAQLAAAIAAQVAAFNAMSALKSSFKVESL